MSITARIAKGPLVPTLVIVASVAVLTVVWLRPDSINEKKAVATTHDVALGHSFERVSSWSPADWVAVADAVVVGRVTNEESQPSSVKSETAGGEGADLVGRSVSIQVEESLWNSPAADSRPGGSVELTVDGWLTRDGVLTERASSGSSRLEVGHTYVLALVWKPAECDPESASPAQWAVIGSGGAIPADDGVLGRGEFQGSAVDQLERGLLSKDAVAASLLGKKPSDLVPLLENVDSVKRIDFLQGASTC